MESDQETESDTMNKTSKYNTKNKLSIGHRRMVRDYRKHSCFELNGVRFFSHRERFEQ